MANKSSSVDLHNAAMSLLRKAHEAKGMFNFDEKTCAAETGLNTLVVLTYCIEKGWAFRNPVSGDNYVITYRGIIAVEAEQQPAP